MSLLVALLLLLILFKLSTVFRRLFTNSTPAMSKLTVQKVEKLIQENPVFVASKSYCPYCSASKKLLQEVNADAFILELDVIEDGDDIQAALQQITGQRTVPNIFIGGKHIGGNSDLQALGKKTITSKISAAKI